jgi:ADYC domain
MHAFDRVSTGAGVLALLCGGCSRGAPRGEDTGEAAAAAIVENGVSFNGVSFNGVSFNGVQLEPLSLEGLSLGGSELAGVSLVGSSLTGAGPDGGVVSGSDLTGAELAGTLSNGDAVTLRIDGVSTGSAPDILLYTVSSSVAGSGVFQPLCGVGADGTPVQAIPLAGSWDESAGTATGGAHTDAPGSFTLACQGYALAKCVDFGYAPWRTVTECLTPGNCAVRSLAQFHQACTRMLRADYCGDGTATTRNGTQVDLWDNFGIQTDGAPTWNLEAEWSADGAVCVEETRWPTIEDDGGNVQTYIQAHCPSRWQMPGCGGAGSTFFTVNGFDVPLDVRALLRTRVTAQP